MRHSHAFGRQIVNVWGVSLTAVATQVPESAVVSDNEQQIWAVRVCCRGLKGETGKDNDREEG